MRIVIIGGTGHVGTYLVPRLVNSGHEVTTISRQKRQPYQPHDAWGSVKQIRANRKEEEEHGSFGLRLQELEADVVIDMICFKSESAEMLVDALNGKIKHFIHCGTIWVHGHGVAVPTVEDQPKAPFGDYGINKSYIESFLLQQHSSNGFPVTILHPGHIVGPGWIPVNPQGNFNIEVYKRLAAGEELLMPNLGLETLHHVHADDVAQAFQCAIEYSENSIGESYHVVSNQALTMRGYAESLAEWFGKIAKLRFLPWDEWRKTVSENDAKISWDHLAHSPNCSNEKARQSIRFLPAYSSLDAVKESLTWLKAQNKL